MSELVVGGFVANSTKAIHSTEIAANNKFIANTTQVTIAAGVGLSANGGLGTAGQTLASNGSSVYWAATGANVQIFATSGTWTKPSGGTLAVIKCWGGGGSGGGGNGASGGATGGGGGSYNETVILLSSLGSTETVTVGTGGVASNSTNNGSAGGTTTFGSWLTAYGGAGGTNTTANGAHGGCNYLAPNTAGAVMAFPSTNAVYMQDYVSFGTQLMGNGYGIHYGTGLGGMNYVPGGCITANVVNYVQFMGVRGFGGVGGVSAQVGGIINDINRPTYKSGRGTFTATGGVYGYANTFTVAYYNGANSYPGGGGGGGGAGLTSTNATSSGGISVGGWSGNGGGGANATVAATAGSFPGGGGGGGVNSASSSIASGAAGANGQCIVIVI
jgi:hypothetical protein